MRALFAAFLLFCSSTFASFFSIGAGPEGGHGSFRLGADAGYHATRGASAGMSFRYGLHDFLDRQNEYPEFTELELLKARVEVTASDKRFWIDEFTLVRFTRLQPLTSKWAELSWTVDAGFRRIREAICVDCGAGTLNAGLGAAVTPVESLPIDLWLLVETEFVGSPSFSGFPIKPSIGPRAGIRFRLAPWLNGMVFAAYRYRFAAADTDIVQFAAEWRLSLDPSFALNARLLRLSDGWQGTAGLFLYY